MTDAQKPICFVLSPIGEEGTVERTTADKVLKHLICKALGGTFEVIRADADSNPGAITPRIVSSILDASLVVADLSGFNPNVFYELAVAHGFRKPVVHIQKSGEKPAFDVKDMRTVRYDISDPDMLEAAQTQLAKFATHAVEKPETIETPLSSSIKFAELEASTDPVAESSVQVIDAINGLRYEVRRAFTRRPSTQSRASSTASNVEIRGLRRIIRNVVIDGRAEASDFAQTITPDTSTEHDEWLRQALHKVTGETEAPALNRILYDEASAERFGYGDEDDESEDEPPF